MRNLRSDESGLAYAAITAFTALIVIAVAWNLLGPTLNREVFDYTENQMMEDNTYEDFRPTFDMIDWIWSYWPLILIFAAVLYLFLASQRPQSPYG